LFTSGDLGLGLCYVGLGLKNLVLFTSLLWIDMRTSSDGIGMGRIFLRGRVGLGMNLHWDWWGLSGC